MQRQTAGVKKIMITRIAATLFFCTAAPAALFAQTVDLRSPDEFISVVGEIVGFNGVMLRVQTSVGAISVPASEVICYGAGCLETLETNDFSLTASAFQGIVATDASDVQGGTDELLVSFDAPIYGTLYRTLAGAFAVAGDTTSLVELTSAGQISLQNEAGDQTATLTLSDDDATDINIQAVTLGGTAPAAYSGPADWATAAQLSHQMIGLNAFAVIVAPNAGVTEISMNDLARIYAGEITNWSQIGGADVNILPLQTPTNSLVSDELVRLVMEPAGKTIAGNVLTMADEAGISASISQFPGSISVVSATGPDQDLVVNVSGACGVPVAPTTFNIVSGDYPLVRPVMATFDGTPRTSLATELFDYAADDVPQGLLAREGFINHSASLQDGVAKNTRLSGLLGATLDEAQRAAAAQMFQVLFDADRMTPTMTGGPASGPEGGWNRAMLLDVVSALRDTQNAGREIMFVGFGESTAGSEAAIAVSAAAAQDMLSALQQIAGAIVVEGGFTLSSYGFGNVSAPTCYDGQVSGSEYTRVEVWIR
jgi:ABC-type phosphate transport system substrate-binding protein